MTKNKAIMMVGLVLLLVLAMTSQAFAADTNIGIKLEVVKVQEVYDSTGKKTSETRQVLTPSSSLQKDELFSLDILLNSTGAAANEYITGYLFCVDYGNCKNSLERVTRDGNPPNDTNHFTELTTDGDKIVNGVPTVTNIANSNNYGFVTATHVTSSGKLLNSVLNNIYKPFIRYYFKAKTAINVSDLEFVVCKTALDVPDEFVTISAVYRRIEGSYERSNYEFVTIDFPDIPKTYYTVSFNTDGGSSVPNQSVLSGNKAKKPDNPYKEKFVFGGWYSDSAKTMTYTFNETVTSNITLYAKWNDPTTGPYTVSFDTRGGSSVPSQSVAVGGKATKPVPNPTKTNDTFVNWYTSTAFTAVYDFSTDVTGNITLYAKWNSDGAGTGTVTTVKNTAQGVDFSTLDYKNYIEVSGAWAKLNSGDKRSLTVDNATITVPDNFCVGLADIKAEDILKIYLGGDWAKEAYRVYITKNDVDYAWFNPGYFITLVIDSALGDASNADCLVAYDSTDSDKIVTFSRYLLSTKKITVRIMKTADLGLKTNPVSFTDTAGLWMDEAVRFMAARDIVRGVGNNRFDFRSNMSIRDYVLMSMRMFGYKVDDVAGAANYYQVAWDQAKNLGLLANIDNSNSDPITRQQMFLITARLLNKFNFIPDKVEGNSLAKFTDGDKVADYAKDLINSLVAKNLVRGDANNPTLRLPDKSTRAEAAQFLYNIFKDIM